MIIRAIRLWLARKLIGRHSVMVNIDVMLFARPDAFGELGFVLQLSPHHDAAGEPVHIPIRPVIIQPTTPLDTGRLN